MRKFGTSVAAAVLGASALAGCGGGNSTEDYCDTLRDAEESLSAMAGDSPNFDLLDDAFDALGEVADAAPDRLAEEWALIEERVDGIEDAMDEAGVEIGDFFTSAFGGELPEGVTQEEMEAIGEKLQSLDSDEFDEAWETIVKDAKDECDVDLDS